jgi:hypothetical protein
MMCCLKTTNSVLKNGGFVENLLILDNGLVCAHQQYEKKLSWDDGLLYCSLLIIDGYCDWRMPTLQELKYLNHILTTECYYWSFDCKEDDSACVQYINQRASMRHQIYQPKNNQHIIRPVRNTI